MVDKRELALGIIFTGYIDKRLKSTLGVLKTQMANMAGATTKTGRAAASASPKVRKYGDEFSNVGKQLSRVEGGVQRLLAAFKVVAAYGIAGTLTFALIQGLRKGVQTIFEFDQALYNLKAIANASEGDLQAMGNAIFKVAEKTKFSAKEVGDAMVLLAQAGFTAEEAVAAIDPVARLATGTLSDLKTSSDLLTTVIRAFSLEASEAGRVADVMANAVNRSKLTVDKLRVSFNYLGPVAKKVGLTIEETAAATMVLANAGIRASTIGTGLRQVLARLKAPNEKLREAFISAGADMSRFTGSAFNMREAMLELVKIVPNATRAFELFGLRGAPAVAALTEAGVAGFDDMYDSVLRAGEATRMAETQMQGLVVMAKNLSDRLGTLAVRLGEGGIAAAFEVFIRAGREVVKVLSDLAETRFAQLVVAVTTLSTVMLALAGSFRFLTFASGSLIAGLASVLAPASLGIAFFKSYVKQVGALTLAYRTLRRAMILHPLFFLATAVLAVVAAYKIWIRHSKQQLLNWEAEEKAATSRAKTLIRYREELEKLVPGTKEYGAALRRLGADFEELKRHIDESTNSFDDHGEAHQRLIEKEADKALYRIVSQLKEYVKELDKLKKREITPDVEFMPELIGGDIPDTLDKTAEAAARLENKFERLPELFNILGYTVDSSVKSIKDKVEELVEGTNLQDRVNDMVSIILIGLIRIKYGIEETVKDAKTLVEGVPDYWKKVFNELDAEGQVYFVQSLSMMEKQVASFEKRSKDLELSEKQLAAARTAIRLKGIKDFVEKTWGEIKSAEWRRNKLIELEDELAGQKKDLHEKALADLRIFTDEDIRQVHRRFNVKKDVDAKIAKIKDDRKKQEDIIDQKYEGEQEAFANIRFRRRIRDEREYQKEILRIRQTHARIMATLEVDPLRKLEQQNEARLALIKRNQAIELEGAKNNKARIKEINDKARNEEAASNNRFEFDKAKLQQDTSEETLKLEAARMELTLEKMRSAAVSQFETSQEFKLRELELEERLAYKYVELAEKRLATTRELYGEDHKETIKSKRELEEALTALEKNYGDQRRKQREIDQKALLRSTQAYLDQRIEQMRKSGATEDEMERVRWEHMAQYSQSWLKKMRAGLGLATLEFRAAAADWAGLVQNMAQTMGDALGDYFFNVIKGRTQEGKEALENMLDAWLRAIAKFMADKAMADFLLLLGQIAGGAGMGGGAGSPATYESKPGSPGASAFVGHTGGQAGVDVLPKRFVPDWLFNLAPRLHSGLRPDEFPAILQRGEQVTPRDETGGGGPTTVNIFTPDTKTMSEWVDRNRSLFAGAMSRELRGGNRGLINSVRRTARG